MTREEMLSIFEEMYDVIHDAELIPKMDQLRKAIEDLTVRVELSVEGGNISLDKLQGSSDIRVIMDVVDHDEEFYKAEVDGSFIESVMPFEDIKMESIKFGNDYNDEDYQGHLAL